MFKVCSRYLCLYLETKEFRESNMKSGLILRSKIFPENTSTVLDNLLSYSSSPCSDYGTLEVKLKFV